MAKMAFFKLGAHLSFTPDANFDIGTGAYKIQFDVMAAPHVFRNDGAVSPVVLSIVGTPGARDGVKHTLIVERVGSTITTSLDGVVLSSVGDENNLTRDFFGTIGNNSPALQAVIGSYPYSGYLSNVKIYSGATLLLDMPLTDDLLDHSANAYVITNTDVELLDVGNSIDYTIPSQVSAEYDSGHYISGALVGGESFLLDTTPVFGSNIRTSSAVVTAYGIDKTSCAYRFTLDEALPQGKVIRSALLVLRNNYTGLLTGAGTKARIRCEKAAAPAQFSDLTDYAARRLNLTTAYIAFDDVEQIDDFWDYTVVDITSIVQEVVTNYSPTTIAVFIDDETLGSTDGNAYSFQPSPDGGDAVHEIVIQYEDASASSYSVTYDGNTNTGGTVPVDSNTYEELDTVTVLTNSGSLVKTGNIFIGWNTVADGSGADYEPADTFAMGTANVTLYAQWTEETGDKLQLKKPCLIKPVLEKIGLVRPRLIKSK